MFITSRVIEKAGMKYACEYLKREGYEILDEKQRGCDLVAQKSNEKFFVEVKGRAREWAWVSCSRRELELLEGKPDHAFLLEVIINPTNKSLVKIKKWSSRNIVKKRPHTIAVYFSETQS